MVVLGAPGRATLPAKRSPISIYDMERSLDAPGGGARVTSLEREGKQKKGYIRHDAVYVCSRYVCSEPTIVLCGRCARHNVHQPVHMCQVSHVAGLSPLPALCFSLTE